MQLKQKISIQNIYVVILLILIGMAGLLTYSQSKTKNELVESASIKNDSAGNRKNVKPKAAVKSDKASKMLTAIQNSLKQPKDFPFQPEWSNEIYDPNRKIDEAYQKVLKRHVMLRNFYSSNVRFSEEFLKLHKLLVDYGFENDPVVRIELFSNLRILEMLRKPLEADPALVDPRLIKDMEMHYNDFQRHVVNVVTRNYQIDSPIFLESYMKIRPNEGFGMPDTRIEPFEPLLIK